MTQMIQIHSIQVAYIILQLIIEAIFGQTNVQWRKEQSCDSSPCSCCLTNSPCTANNTDCGYQCEDGYLGMRCFNRCPLTCLRCIEHPNVTDYTFSRNAYCQECKDGYYSTPEFFQCQFNCPAACHTCDSDTKCTTCIDGYVLQGTTCNLQCKSGCAECSSCDNCIRCMDGYYTSGTDCLACSGGCSNQCDKRTGNCNCKPGFDGEKCERCLAQFNGTDCNICIDGSHGESCALAQATGGYEERTPWTVLGGVVAGSLVLIAIVILIIILFRRRLRRASDDLNRQIDDVPMYINVISANTTKETKTKARKLQKYEHHQLKHHQKEVKYAEKVAKIKHELEEMTGPPSIRGVEDGANSGTESQTYECLDEQEAGDHLYSNLGTK